MHIIQLTRVLKVDRAEPLEGRLPSPLLPHVHLLDEVQAGQHVGDVVEPSHLGCGTRRCTVQLANVRTRIAWPAPSPPLTFVLAVARQVLALVDEGPGRRVQRDRLGLGHQEQHDKLLAHDAQGFVFPVGASFGIRKKEKGREPTMSLEGKESTHSRSGLTKIQLLCCKMITSVH